MSVYAVRYVASLLGAANVAGLLKAITSPSSVLIRRNGVADTIYSDRTKTALANPISGALIGVGEGLVGVDTLGQLTFYADPGDGLDAVVTYNGVPHTFAIPGLPVDPAEPVLIGETFVTASQAAMLALTAQRGDLAIRTDLNPDGVFWLAADDPTQLVNWIRIGAVDLTTDGAAGTPSLRTLGTGAQQAAAGADLAAEIVNRVADVNAEEAARLALAASLPATYVEMTGDETIGSVEADRKSFFSAVPRRFPLADVMHASFDSPEAPEADRDRVRFQKCADWCANADGPAAMHVPRKGSTPWTLTKATGIGAWCINVKTGTKIFGDGRASELKLADGQATSSRMIRCAGSGAKEVEICDLAINGNKANNPLANDQSHGIFCDDVTKIKIHDVWLWDIAGDGIYLFDILNRAEVTNNWIDDASRQGINIGGADYVLVQGNNIKNPGANCIKAEISSRADQSHQLLVDNILYGGSSGISYIGENTTRVMRSVIARNLITNPASSGIQLARAGLIDVIGNHITAPAASGIGLLRDVYDATIAFNTVEGALGTGTTDGGIAFGGIAGSSSHDIRLLYNLLTGGAWYGMNLRANGTDGLHKVRSVGNIMRSNASYGLRLSGVVDFKSVDDEFRLNGNYAVHADTLSTVVPKDIRFYRPVFELANVAHSPFRWTGNIDGLSFIDPELLGTTIPTTPFDKGPGADILRYFQWRAA